MSNIVIAGDTSGSVTLQAPAVAGGSVQTFTSASGTIAPLVRDTAVTASGTSFDFTGIPNWAKRITVMFSGVSTNGTSGIYIQLGDAGGIENTGYSSTSFRADATTVATSTGAGAGYLVASIITSNATSGLFTITNISGNTWVIYGGVYGATTTLYITCQGTKTLSDVLTQVRIATVNGINTFNAGTVNILIEG